VPFEFEYFVLFAWPILVPSTNPDGENRALQTVGTGGSTMLARKS
jgi:hypothetical protein